MASSGVVCFHTAPQVRCKAARRNFSLLCDVMTEASRVILTEISECQYPTNVRFIFVSCSTRKSGNSIRKIEWGHCIFRLIGVDHLDVWHAKQVSLGPESNSPTLGSVLRLSLHQKSANCSSIQFHQFAKWQHNEPFGEIVRPWRIQRAYHVFEFASAESNHSMTHRHWSTSLLYLNV